MPRLHQAPRRAVTLGDDAVAWAESIGWSPRKKRGFYKLDAWQKFCVRGILSEDANARLCASVCLLLVPRQNGKNVVLEVIELYAFFVMELRYILHTAHLAETSADHMDHLWDAIQSDKVLRSRCKRVVANGKERIYSTEGDEPGVDEVDEDDDENPKRRTIRFRTRSKKIGRGGSPQMAVFDEALHLTDRQQSGTLPSLSAQSAGPDKPILVYVSSAPVEADEAEVLLRIRAAVLAGDMPDAWFAEWSVELDESVDWDEALRRMIADKDGWFAANPGMPERISPDWVDAVERPTMSAEAFAVERLGLFIDAERSTSSVIPNWGDLHVKGSSIASHGQWALAVSPLELGPQWASIGKAGATADGRQHVEWVDHRRGTHWIVQVCKEHYETIKTPIRVHANGPEGAFIDQLIAAGVKVDEVSSSDVSRATGAFVAAATGDPDEGVAPSLCHLDQPSLNKAVRFAVLKNSSDGAVTWSQLKSTVEITPLKAVTVALGGVPEKVEVVNAPFVVVG